ncbi:MAG: hypothetical protein OXU75_02220 [Deltaproteobacteria bacterium]|nr:hypothetical protein [Deltaproteobacteria bacterium]
MKAIGEKAPVPQGVETRSIDIIARDVIRIKTGIDYPARKGSSERV